MAWESGAANLLDMLHKILLQEFEKRALHNPQYSLRSFARDLQINSGTLSSILNHRRPIGPKVLAHMMKVLPLSIAEKKKILSSLFVDTSPETEAEVPTLLTEEILTVIKDWEHYAILAYLQLPNARQTPGGLASDLDIPQSRALRALSNLEAVGLIRRSANWFVSSYKSIITSRGIPSPALREAHRQYLDKAKWALEHLSVEERDITGVTMAISRKNLPKAKELITQFRKDLSGLLAQGQVDDIYRLNLQLFPLTKLRNKEDSK